MPRKYHIITFGCQMNESDSERIASVLDKKGYSQTPNKNEADLIVVNMCSVRQTAVDRVFGASQKLARLKTLNPKLKTILTGCILPADKKKFLGKFDSVSNAKDLLKRHHGLVRGTIYVPISNGCNNACAYCAVPLTRGPLTCRDHKKIIKDIEKASRLGLKEIWLLGQNVNNYQSPAEPKINFARLLCLANNLPGNFKIRFMSPHPAYFTDELINVMANGRKIAHYLNLPLQSGDNKILKAMNRPYNASRYKKLVKKIRKKIPDINFSTDIIVGFPGETKKQFENTVKLFKELKFNIAYISKYSPRQGTAAFSLKNNVPLIEKKRRWKILNDLINKKSG